MKTIAIIGGGVSGLFLSCFLRGKGWDVDIYEKNKQVGGNCVTASVDVDGRSRWADIAVNDFNEPMYQEVYDLMQALGVETPLLEDTASFFTRDGTVTYTVDGGYRTPMSRGFEAQYTRFQERAVQVLNDPKNKGMSLRRFLETEGYSKEFIERCILPRANAMYFCDDRDVGSMPIQAVLHYYVLQEGFGTDKPVRRRYFRKGTRVWISRLKEASGARFFAGSDVRVKVTRGNPRVVIGPGETRPEEREYDALVFACHANQARAALCWEGLQADARITSLLDSIRYVPSTGYVHTFEGLLPKERRAWRTYNVLIRDYEQELHTPYSMTYVLNHHQADSLNRYDDYFGARPYFVTLNPFVRIPDEHRLADEAGGTSEWSFPHNVVNDACIRAQEALWSASEPIQGQHQLYFTGGWTLGAGLHIECWESAKEVANLLEEPGRPSEMTYDSTRGPERFAPKHIRRLAGLGR